MTPTQEPLHPTFSLQKLGLSQAEQARVERLSSETGERYEIIVRQLGLVTDRRLLEYFSDVLESPIVTAEELDGAAVLVDESAHVFLRRHRVVPLSLDEKKIECAFADPLNGQVTEALRFAFERALSIRAALPADIDAALARLYANGENEQAVEAPSAASDSRWESDLERLREEASEAPVIRRVNTLIIQAVEIHASDIHFESTDSGLKTRYRIDGVLSDVDQAPVRMSKAIISRLKVMANLDIAERRLSQDGRLRLPIQGKEIDFRISTTPSSHGENVVLRILDRDRTVLDFGELGFDHVVLARWLGVIRRPHGVVLVSGPTGSGKTTTLYTSLKELNTPDRKILTVEDPVEYLMAGINQTQVKPQIGLSFANVLRSFLRQDPDVMMVGEIRDLETAQIAIQASLTGHLVLSTVHTNDAASAMARLIDMGIERYLLASTVSGVLAQRLVRRLCPACKVVDPASQQTFEALGVVRKEMDDVVLYEAVGCSRCSWRGYTGRTMIIEFLEMTDRIRSLVMQGQTGSVHRTDPDIR